MTMWMANWIVNRELTQKRFDKHCCPEPNTGCMLWFGATSPRGYGNATVNGKSIRASQLAWLLSGRDIPDGMSVLHKCDMRCCVEITHLFLGTILDNSIDMASKGRGTQGQLYGVTTRPGKRGATFQAQCQHNGVSHYLGMYATAEEASAVATEFKRNLIGAYRGSGRRNQ